MTDISKRVKQYVELRDKMKELKNEYEEKMKPYNEALEKLRGVLLNHLNSSKVESMRTIHGTFYRSSKQSCSIVDKEMFWDFVVEHEAWDLIDKRANAQAVYDYSQEHKVMPPGVNYSSWDDVGVRRN